MGVNRNSNEPVRIRRAQGFAAKWAMTASATFVPTTRASSSRVARLTPDKLPNAVNSVFLLRKPIPGTTSSSDCRSRFLPRLAMERDREAMRLVADALQQAQRVAVRIEREAAHAVAREHQLLFLRKTHSDQVRQADGLERRIRRVQLTFAAVDDDQIWKRTTIFETFE
jgi:hypothetical protein